MNPNSTTPIEWVCPQTGQELSLIPDGPNLELVFSDLGSFWGHVLYEVTANDWKRMLEVHWRVIRPRFHHKPQGWDQPLIVLCEETRLGDTWERVSYWPAPEVIASPARIQPASPLSEVQQFLLDGLAPVTVLASFEDYSFDDPDRTYHLNLAPCRPDELLPGARALLEDAARAQGERLRHLGGSFDPSPLGWARGVSIFEHHSGEEPGGAGTIVLVEMEAPRWRVAHRVEFGIHRGLAIFEVVGESLVASAWHLGRIWARC